MTANLFLGLDVQVRRGCPYYVLDESGRHVTSGWIHRSLPATQVQQFAQVVAEFGSDRIAVGIDSPREPLPYPRRWGWRGGRWSAVDPAVGSGRHAELVVNAFNLATPQWTPVRDQAPEWMKLGFGLFEALQDFCAAFEVFPTAAYRMLRETDAVVTLSLGAFADGPKDMLDAAIAALSVRDYLSGLGCAVGGGDGLGAIVLPRQLPPGPSAVLTWPEPLGSSKGIDHSALGSRRAYGTL